MEALTLVAKASSRHSLFKGVTLYKPTSKWRAQISHGGRTVTLGDYNTEEEAARVFDRACICKYGRDAVCNFPLEDYTDEWEELCATTIPALLVKFKEERQCSKASRAAIVLTAGPYMQRSLLLQQFLQQPSGSASVSRTRISATPATSPSLKTNGPQPKLTVSDAKGIPGNAIRTIVAAAAAAVQGGSNAPPHAPSAHSESRKRCSGADLDATIVTKKGSQLRQRPNDPCSHPPASATSLSSAVPKAAVAIATPTAHISNPHRQRYPAYLHHPGQYDSCESAPSGHHITSCTAAITNTTSACAGISPSEAVLVPSQPQVYGNRNVHTWRRSGRSPQTSPYSSDVWDSPAASALTSGIVNLDLIAEGISASEAARRHAVQVIHPPAARQALPSSPGENHHSGLRLSGGGGRSEHNVKYSSGNVVRDVQALALRRQAVKRPTTVLEVPEDAMICFAGTSEGCGGASGLVILQGIGRDTLPTCTAAGPMRSNVSRSQLLAWPLPQPPAKRLRGPIEAADALERPPPTPQDEGNFMTMPTRAATAAVELLHRCGGSDGGSSSSDSRGNSCNLIKCKTAPAIATRYGILVEDAAGSWCPTLNVGRAYTQLLNNKDVSPTAMPQPQMLIRQGGSVDLDPIPVSALPPLLQQQQLTQAAVREPGLVELRQALLVALLKREQELLHEKQVQQQQQRRRQQQQHDDEALFSLLADIVSLRSLRDSDTIAVSRSTQLPAVVTAECFRRYSASTVAGSPSSSSSGGCDGTRDVRFLSDTPLPAPAQVVVTAANNTHVFPGLELRLPLTLPSVGPELDLHGRPGRAATTAGSDAARKRASDPETASVGHHACTTLKAVPIVSMADAAMATRVHNDWRASAAAQCDASDGASLLRLAVGRDVEVGTRGNRMGFGAAGDDGGGSSSVGGVDESMASIDLPLVLRVPAGMQQQVLQMFQMAEMPQKVKPLQFHHLNTGGFKAAPNLARIQLPSEDGH